VKKQRIPAIEDLNKMRTVTFERLRRMKSEDKPSCVVYFCNECGRPELVPIYCCPVEDNPDRGLGNFTECVVWFKKGIVRRVIHEKVGG
jgi:hypothetical protein